MDSIPKEVEQFIEANIETIDQLRILLLLQNSPEQDWSVDTVRGQLGFSREKVAVDLARLAARGFFSTTPGPNTTYRYGPSTVSHSSMVSRLARLDCERPVTLINLVYAKGRG